MTQIEIYTKPTCPYCYRAKRLLDAMNTDYIEYDLSSDIEKRSEMISRTHGFTVPQIIIDNQPVGGSDELFELLEKGVPTQPLREIYAPYGLWENRFDNENLRSRLTLFPRICLLISWNFFPGWLL